MGGACGTMGQRKGAYRVGVGRCKGKRPFMRPNIDGKMKL